MTSNSLKVLFCIHSLSNGGAERVLINTINELKVKTNWNIDLLLVVNDRSMENRINKNIKICNIFSGETRITRQLVKHIPPDILHKMYVKGDYDIEVAFLEGDATKIIAGAKAPKICWIHTDMNHYRWTEKYYRSSMEEMKCYSRYDKRICVSEAVGKEFSKKYKLETKFMMNLLNPSEAKLLSEQYEDPYDHSFINTVSVGSIKPVKGYERVIDAYTKANITKVNWKHHFVGEGPDESKLKLAAKRSFPDNFVFEGYKDNPYPWIKHADLLICSSFAEGFSSVVYEALILGVPVLTTDVSGMREMLGDSQWGMIVDNSMQGLKEGLLKLLNGGSALNELKCKAGERGHDLSRGYQVHEIINLIEQLSGK